MAFRSYDNDHFKGDMAENERVVRNRRSPRSGERKQGSDESQHNELEESVKISDNN